MSRQAARISELQGHSAETARVFATLKEILSDEKLYTCLEANFQLLEILLFGVAKHQSPADARALLKETAEHLDAKLAEMVQ
jgi:hypothetical protein